VRDAIVDALRLGRWLRIALIPLLSGAPIALIVDRYIGEIPGDMFNMLIGVLLIATAIVTLKAGGIEGYRSVDEVTSKELLLIGVLQGLAALPGLSRSAITIAGLLLLRIEPLTAVKASFTMGVAATGAMALYELVKGVSAPASLLAIILISSLIAGLASAQLMITLARKYNDKIAIFTTIIAALAIISALPTVVR
jgi:undecaprenyl-diphosphatase